MPTRSAPPVEADLRALIATLHRRAGFGLHPDELSTEVAAAEGNPDVVVRRLLAPVNDDTDPWAGVELDVRQEGRGNAIRAWLAHFVTTRSNYADRRTLMLHGWLVSGLGKSPPETMVEQMQLYGRVGGGSFPDLLRAVSTDRAMLIYLDGLTSTAAAPNENFGRELLELFALGVGNGIVGDPAETAPYSEDDVKAAAAALTGWVVRRSEDGSRFVPSRHDDTPQRLLGVDGVRDVDSVIDAIVEHPRHARFVADRVATEYVGDVRDERLDGALDELSEVYVSSDRSLDATIAAALAMVAGGRSSPIVLAPVPWMISAMRALGVGFDALPRSSTPDVIAMGEIPLMPPNVAGWDRGASWFSTSSLVARTHIASQLAASADPSEAVVVATGDGDTDRLANLLGLAVPFEASTAAAITGAADPTAGLTLALVSPEYLLS